MITYLGRARDKRLPVEPSAPPANKDRAMIAGESRPQPLQMIESVPNFSEGRRPEVVAAIVEAIRAPGVLLLDAEQRLGS